VTRTRGYWPKGKTPSAQGPSDDQPDGSEPPPHRTMAGPAAGGARQHRPLRRGRSGARPGTTRTPYESAGAGSFSVNLEAG